MKVWYLRQYKSKFKNNFKLRPCINVFNDKCRWSIKFFVPFSIINRTVTRICYKLQWFPQYLYVTNVLFTRSEVRTHADIRPLELKSNALTTRPSWLGDMLSQVNAMWNITLCSKFFGYFRNIYNLHVKEWKYGICHNIKVNLKPILN